MTESFKVSEKTIKEMENYFKDKQRDKTPQYAKFQANEADTVVTLYESGKVVFQGKSADVDADIWKTIEKKNNPSAIFTDKKKDKKKKENQYEPDLSNASTIGSDEVGTGDYFGPIVVTAALIFKEDINELKELGIKDSKKLTDEFILNIGPSLIKKYKHSTIMLSNKEYNEKYSSDLNMNKIKAIMHNKVLTDLLKDKPEISHVVVDQFARPTTYYNYLKEIPNYIKNITFMTKAEDKVMSVAVGAIIARYTFLKEIEKMGNKIESLIPLGASDFVDDVATSIAKKHGIEKLNELVKLNFKNTDKVKDKLVN